MKTAGIMFAGGGIGTCGVVAAGVEPIWSIEMDPDIAAVGALNHPHKWIVAKVEDLDPCTLERPDFLILSPVCTNASRANVNGKESESDLSAARACCEFIRVLKPDNVVMENVWQYRHFESFKMIVKALENEGYFIDIQHLDAANFGVPQNRCRMILRACMNRFIPHLPDPLPWVGWYSAIEDLLPWLEESEFAPWQMLRMPSELKTMIIGGGNSNKSNPTGLPRYANQPANTTTKSTLGRDRAYLVDPNNCSREFTTRRESEPSFCVVSSHMRRPISTPQAYLVDGDNTGRRGHIFREGLRPSPSVSQSTAPRAFICDGQSNSDGQTMTLREAQEPVFTVSATCDRRPARAYDNGRVVKLNARCLARFQSIPDSYILPSKNKLAATIIGGGVPCLMMQRVIEGMV